MVRFGHTDGLRGFGVLLVIFYHMGYDLMVNAWFCISMFFCCSGFLITAITIEAYERKGYVDILRFWSRRISRLFPAAILTIVAITLSQQFRYDDGINFKTEQEDLVFASLFATNYNLVYRNKDDYFNEFLHPSITRHMWTLSIEEQYYLFWPLLIFAWTYLFGNKKANVKQNPNEFDMKNTNKSTMTNTCLWALALGEILVISFSVFSSWATIDQMGVTAAYYSTWCRMGDIACGGLAYIGLRLSPLDRRYQLEPGLEPMSKSMRIMLDACIGMGIMYMIVLPMCPVPVNDMLQLYFQWLRVLFSSSTSFFIAMGSIQYTEPLPYYCYFSRLCSWKPLTLLGFCSYGIYLFHWPIIVLLGDPMGSKMNDEHTDFEEDIDWTAYHLRNAFIFTLAITLGFVSFFFYEKPLIMKAKGKSALSIIAAGFLGVAISMIILYVSTKDIMMMEITNDSAEIFVDITDDRTSYILPCYAFDEPQREMYYNVLDTHTRPLENTMIKHGTSEVTDPYDTIRIRIDSHAGPDANVTAVVCKSWLITSPCDDEWPKYLQWAWLDSPLLCGEYDSTADEAAELDISRRCDDKLSITEISVDKNNYTTTEKSSYATVLELDKAFPDSLNAYSMYRIGKSFDEIMSGNFVPAQHMQMTFIGESVAAKVGMLSTDLIEIVVSEEFDEQEKDSMPDIGTSILGHTGQPAIGYYACSSDNPDFNYDDVCSLGNEEIQDMVLEGFSATKPDTVVIHDTHWWYNDIIDGSKFGHQVPLESDFDKVFAFNMMAKDAFINGVQSIVYMTFSASDKKTGAPPSAYTVERNKLLKTIDALSCPEGSPNSLVLTVFDWALLTCPTLETTGECAREAHGFIDILPDGQHPSGNSGDWLVANFLNAVLADLMYMVLSRHPKYEGLYETYAADWQSAKLNPYSQHLGDQYAPDNDQPLEDLLHNYVICPNMDDYSLQIEVSKLEGKVYNDWSEISLPLE